MGSGGHNRKTVAEHVAAGTYRQDRHGPLVHIGEVCAKPLPRVKTRCGRARKWVRTAADEYAISKGCWFDESLAAYVVEWFRTYLTHSKGVWAGKSFDLLPWQVEEIIYPVFGWLRPGKTRRIRRTYIEIPKKNGKSTLAAGVGLYMLCGDDEAGANCYSAAGDREQASIVHGEAIAMVDSSPKLSGFLKVNRSTKAIYHTKQRLSYRAISSRPQSQEGHDGSCCIIDELHAWYGSELWDALKYMGRARRQPLSFVITTAGDDMESVCRKQNEYGKSVNSGEFKDDRFHCLIHSAEESDDFRSPEIQHNANPSLGATIDELQFNADLDEAFRIPSERASFLRYSFNIWATATNPWLDKNAWDACESDVSEEHLATLPCWGGLDLARKWDMSAFVLVFYDEDAEKFHQRAWFWMPRKTAEKRSHLASYDAWEETGHLCLTDGNVVDYSCIEQEVCDIIGRYSVHDYAFDEKYAEELTQRITATTGIERIAFAQTLMAFCGPTALYERLVIDGKLHHDGNPVLTWQAGHVAASKPDANQNIRPVKLRRGDHRVIDGIVGGVMALARAQVNEIEQRRDYYEEAELEFA